MSDQPFDKPGFIQRIQSVVQRGDRIRQRVAEEVASALHETQMDSEGLTALAHAVIEAARTGLDQSMLPDRAGALREVAEGLADGLATASDALRLTILEAKGRGRRFAREDLDRIASDLQALGGMFVSTFTETARRLGGAAAAEGRAFREHVERTYQRLRPSVESALAAARDHPIALGKETLQAGLTAGALAAGTLFSEVGKRLQRIGQRLQGGGRS